MRTDSATFTALCYPMLTLLVRKQMDSPYESFHQRPLMHPQAIFLVYVKDNSSIGDILPLFFLFLTPPPPAPHLGHHSRKTYVHAHIHTGLYL